MSPHWDNYVIYNLIYFHTLHGFNSPTQTSPQIEQHSPEGSPGVTLDSQFYTSKILLKAENVTQEVQSTRKPTIHLTHHPNTQC